MLYLYPAELGKGQKREQKGSMILRKNVHIAGWAGMVQGMNAVADPGFASPKGDANLLFGNFFT